MVRFQGQYLQLERLRDSAPARARVDIFEATDGAIDVHYNGRRIPWTRFTPPD